MTLRETLTDPFRRAGYHVQRAEKAAYYQAMIALAGSLEKLAFLRDAGIMRLFSDAKFRTGSALTVSALLRIIQPGDGAAKTRTLEQIAELARHQILLRGVVLRCPTCDFVDCYDLSALEETVICLGCHSAFQLPLNQIEFSYRLNHLWVRGLNQGALTVLLAALQLRELTPDRFVWDAGYLFSKDGQRYEVDLIAECGGRLILAECKNNFAPQKKNLADELQALLQGIARRLDAPNARITQVEALLDELRVEMVASQKAAEMLIAQLRDGIALARDVNAGAFIFATLYSDVLPESVIAFLRAADSRSLRTALLTQDDLLGSPSGIKAILESAKN